MSLREFQDNKADVIVKYTADEARSCMSSCFMTPHQWISFIVIRRRIHRTDLIPLPVKAYGELPENAKINETAGGDEGGDEECGFEFGADGEDSELDIDDI